MSKRLIARSKLSNRQLHQLVDFFALEVSPLKAARVIGINRHSAERVYHIILRHLAWACEHHSPLRGEVEATSPTLEATGRASKLYDALDYY
jgi:hypothetical protein